MVGDDHEPAAFLEGSRGALEELLQGTHLLVHLDAEGLVDLGEDLVLGALGKDAGDGAVQVAGGADLPLVPRGGDELGDPAGLVHLAVQAEDALQVLDGGAVHEVGGGRPAVRVHPHVQRGVLVAEREAAVRGVELVRGHAQVRQDAVETDPEVAGVVLDETEIVVHHRQTLVVRRVAHGVPVTIEGDDARAIV